MALRNLPREDTYLRYDLIGGIDHRPVGWRARVRQEIERLPPALGVAMVAGVGIGLYGGALAGVYLGLAGNGSLIYVLLAIPLIASCAAVAAHLTPPRISELRE
ncbi:MAG: hypothetical protein L3K16_02455 [Thermoplasmata archaeon]|nr:hypothetical protein [Thermoplasmata archaeon]